MNKKSSIGLAEELIGALTNQTAEEQHLKVMLDDTDARIKNGLYDTDEELANLIEKHDRLHEYIRTATDTRRRTLAYLYDLGTKEQDQKFWCTVKHKIASTGMLFEAMQAADMEDDILEELYFDSKEQLNLYITEFLGLTITACSTCVADSLGTLEG